MINTERDKEITEQALLGIKDTEEVEKILPAIPKDGTLIRERRKSGFDLNTKEIKKKVLTQAAKYSCGCASLGTVNYGGSCTCKFEHTVCTNHKKLIHFCGRQGCGKRFIETPGCRKLPVIKDEYFCWKHWWAAIWQIFTPRNDRSKILVEIMKEIMDNGLLNTRVPFLWRTAAASPTEEDIQKVRSYMRYIYKMRARELSAQSNQSQDEKK